VVRWSACTNKSTNYYDFFNGAISMTSKIVFVANSSKRYRYYSLIAERCKGQAKVIFPVYPSLALLVGAFTKPPVDENMLLVNHLQRQASNYPKLTKSVLLWKVYCAIARITERARFGHYFALFSRLDCEAVAIWNGQRQPYLTMVAAAKQAKKRVLYFENGLLPDTTTADYNGVNAFNSLPREASFYLSLNSMTLAQQAVRVPSALVPRDPHRKRAISSQKLDTLPQNYIFIPFQVPTDSQIMVQSPWVHSMEQMYHLILAAHTRLYQASDDDDIPYLVFKEHPSWPGNFASLYHQHPHCLFANENNTQALIENAQAVITINSTVGLESLLLGQKVITLGNACYNVEGMVLHADNEAELFDALSRVSSWICDEALRHNFLHYVAATYCIPGEWQKMLDQPDEVHFDAMLARVFETDELAQAAKK
jgi:capsular polysaccharide export protein